MRKADAAPFLLLVLPVLALGVLNTFPDRRPPGTETTATSKSAYCPNCKSQVAVKRGKCPKCNKSL